MDPHHSHRLTRICVCLILRFAFRYLRFAFSTIFYFLTIRPSYISTLSVRSLNSHTTHVPIARLSSPRLLNLPLFISYVSFFFLLWLSYSFLDFLCLFFFVAAFLPYPYVLFLFLLLCCYPPLCPSTYPILCSTIYCFSLWYVVSYTTAIPFLHRSFRT